MAKEENKKKADEVIEILEEDIPPKSSGRSWSEELEMAGSDVAGFLRNIWTEATVRRVIIRNQNGETVLNLPIGAGALGILFPSLIVASAAGVGVALLTKCTVTIERHAADEEEVAA